MCEYCEGGKRKPLYDNETTYIGITDENAIYIDYCDGFGWGNNFFSKLLGIKYCPMCGRKLEGKEEQC